MSVVTQANVNPNPIFDAREKRDRRANLARRAGRFRILIMGRANAGKTTILKKICNTTDEPEIYNSKGKKIDRSTIEPTAERGIHDINNEMIFQSNPGFIFHDSRGFEAGGSDELQNVKRFVSERSKERKLVNQVHVIWYCIPLDDSRPFQHAEDQFFSEVGTGKVPVVVVFTKCEALEHEAVNILEEQGHSFKDAVKGSANYAKKHLQIAHIKLQNYKYQPKGHVYLQEMEKPNTNCKILVECTADVLDSSTLQAIFVSTQQASLEISIKYAIEKTMYQYLKKDMMKEYMSEDTKDFLWMMLKNTMRYFPYWRIGQDPLVGAWTIFVSKFCLNPPAMFPQDYNDYDHVLYHLFDHFDHVLYHDYHVLHHLHHFDHVLDDDPTTIVPIHTALIQLATEYLPFPTQHQVIHFCTAFAIIAEQLYFICNKAREFTINHISSSITLFYQSPVCAAVVAQIEEASTIYSTSIAELHSSIWSRVTFNLSSSLARKRKNEIKEALVRKVNSIVLENRLDKTGL